MFNLQYKTEDAWMPYITFKYLSTMCTKYFQFFQGDHKHSYKSTELYLEVEISVHWDAWHLEHNSLIPRNIGVWSLTKVEDQLWCII